MVLIGEWSDKSYSLLDAKAFGDWSCIHGQLEMSLRRSKAAAAERRKTILEKPNPAGRQYYSITMLVDTFNPGGNNSETSGSRFSNWILRIDSVTFFTVEWCPQFCQPLLANSDKELVLKLIQMSFPRQWTVHCFNLNWADSFRIVKGPSHP